VTRDGGEVTTDRTIVPASRPPVIVRTDPPAHKRDVPLNASIVVVFSEPIAPGALADGSVIVRRGAELVQGQVTFANDQHFTAVFTPSGALTPGADYELVVTTSVKNLGGLPLDSTIAVPFSTTPPLPVPPALTLVQSEPAHGTVGVKMVGPDLVLTFSEPIVFASLYNSIAGGYSNIRLSLNGVRVNETGLACLDPVGETCQRIGIRPEVFLLPGLTYQLIALPGVLGRSGATLAAPVSVSFTTENPPPGPSIAQLQVESFSIVEYQFDSNSPYWF
jgi:hypothetical protein